MSASRVPGTRSSAEARKHPAILVVAQDEACVLVEHHQTIGHVFHGVGKLPAAFHDLVLQPLARGEVAVVRQQADDGAGGVAQRRFQGRQPGVRTVVADERLFDRLGFALRQHPFLVDTKLAGRLFRVEVEIGLADHRRHVRRSQLFGRCRIGGQEASAHVLGIERFGQRIDDAAIEAIGAGGLAAPVGLDHRQSGKHGRHERHAAECHGALGQHRQQDRQWQDERTGHRRDRGDNSEDEQIPHRRRPAAQEPVAGNADDRRDGDRQNARRGADAADLEDAEGRRRQSGRDADQRTAEESGQRDQRLAKVCGDARLDIERKGHQQNDPAAGQDDAECLAHPARLALCPVMPMGPGRDEDRHDRQILEQALPGSVHCAVLSGISKAMPASAALSATIRHSYFFGVFGTPIFAFLVSKWLMETSGCAGAPLLALRQCRRWWCWPAASGRAPIAPPPGLGPV